jgi:hypothetical protein
MATWVRVGSRSYRSVQAATEADPSGVAGTPLAGVGGLGIHVVCDNGQTFTGTGGSLMAFAWDELVALWLPCPGSDLLIPSAAVGKQGFTDLGWTISAPRGRIAHVCKGVQISGGSITITYACSGIVGQKS